MISYKTGAAGVNIFRLEGSVLPKALCWGMPFGILAAFVNIFWRDQLAEMEEFQKLWAGYTFVLGFLIVFLNSQSYARFWESTTLMMQVKGEWMNAVSGLFAFCSKEEKNKIQVAEFQHLVIRLMSMMHCQALQSVCDLKDDSFEIIDLRGFDESSLEFLASVDNRVEVLLLWLQRSMVVAQTNGTIAVPPPILSRAFQDLTSGMLLVHNVRKIKDVPFPWPYAQMVQVLLVVQSIVTPFLAAQIVESAGLAAGITVLTITSLWSLLYIAFEIEHPFGEDVNDFNMNDMQHAMNKGLLTLIHPLAQEVPGQQFRRGLVLVNSNIHLVGQETKHRLEAKSGTVALDSFISQIHAPEPEELPQIPVLVPPMKKTLQKGGSSVSSLSLMITASGPIQRPAPSTDGATMGGRLSADAAGRSRHSEATVTSTSSGQYQSAHSVGRPVQTTGSGKSVQSHVWLAASRLEQSSDEPGAIEEESFDAAGSPAPLPTVVQRTNI